MKGGGLKADHCTLNMWLFPIKINNIIVQFGIAYSVLLLGILPSPSPSPSPSPIEVRTPLQAGSEGGKSTFVQHFKNVWNIRASNSEARIVKWVFRINTISPMFKERIHQNVYKDNCQRSSSHSVAHIWQILWKNSSSFFTFSISIILPIRTMPIYRISIIFPVKAKNYDQSWITNKKISNKIA